MYDFLMRIDPGTETRTCCFSNVTHVEIRQVRRVFQRQPEREVGQLVQVRPALPLILADGQRLVRAQRLDAGAQFPRGGLDGGAPDLLQVRQTEHEHRALLAQNAQSEDTHNYWSRNK